LFALFPLALATLVFVSPSAAQVGARADRPDAKLSHALAQIAESVLALDRGTIVKPLTLVPS